MLFTYLFGEPMLKYDIVAVFLIVSFGAFLFALLYDAPSVQGAIWYWLLMSNC